MRATSMTVNNHQLEDQRLAGINEELEWKRNIPLGYTFYPTDQEIFDYLKERVRGEPILPGLIYDTDVYRCKPPDLPGLDKESEYSYYFTSRDRKYPNGKRLCRSTKDNIGYWRMTSKLNPLTESDGSPLGKKNTLVYTLNAKGEYGNGLKTDWIMHEYVLDEIRYPMNDVVLCRIYEKKSKQAGKEREQSPSESQGRLCTESSVGAHHQTSLIKRKQSPIHYTVLEVGEPSCSGQWNTPQPYEPSKKSRHLVGEPCQLPTKSSPFHAQLCQINGLSHLIFERSALGVGKSSSEVACQLNQMQPSQEAAFRPLNAGQPIWGENSETISGLGVGNSIAQLGLISSMIDSSRENNLPTHPIVNHAFADGNSVQQMPCESSNGGFWNNLVFSNNGHDQQPENNLSEDHIHFQTQMPCESSNASFWSNLLCSNEHEQPQINLSEEHFNFQTQMPCESSNASFWSNLLCINEHELPQNNLSEEHFNFQTQMPCESSNASFWCNLLCINEHELPQNNLSEEHFNFQTQMPRESSNASFWSNLLCSNEHEQPQNNLSEEHFNFQTQVACESSNASFWSNLLCSNVHEQPQNNLSEEHFNFQTQMPCESSNASFWSNLLCSNEHEQQQNNLSEEHLNFQTGNAGGNQRPTMVTSMAEHGDIDG